MEWGEREIIYLSLNCHHQNDFCIKMGSDESHFNVSVGSDGQSHKTVSTNHNLFWRERRAEAVSNRGPSAYQPNALPLGQTGSRFNKHTKPPFISATPALLPFFSRIWKQSRFALSAGCDGKCDSAKWPKAKSSKTIFHRHCSLIPLIMNCD